MDSDSAHRVLVVRLGSMGDILHALPAVASLRHVFPAAHIGWAVEQRWAALLATPDAIAGPRGLQKPLVDVVHAFDTLAWRTALSSDASWREAGAAISTLRHARYEVAIDFQGAFKSALLAQLSGAPRRIGFAQPREKPATLFYTHQVFARGRHIVEQNLSLTEAWIPGGVPSSESEAASGPESRLPSPDKVSLNSRLATRDSEVFLLPYDPEAECVCERELSARQLDEFAILNPGAGWGAKCWPAERYAEVARALCTEGLRSVVNFGPGEEALARSVEAESGGAAVGLPTSLGELIAFTRHARLFVGGDTGPMHLAAALGVPVVALFGPTDPARNGPFSRNSIVLRSPVSQTRTSHRPQPDEGLLRITVAEVVAAARTLLGVTR